MDKRWAEAISLLLNSWKGGTNYSLNKDEVADLVEVLAIDLNLTEGNITEKEAEEYFENRL